MKSRCTVWAAALVLLGSGMALAGDPEPPGPPSSTFSLNLEAIYARLMSGAAGTPTAFTEPKTAPGTGTMVTLEQIMAAAPAEDNTNGAQPGEVLAGKSFWSLRTDGAGGSAWGLSAGTLPTRTVDATTVSQLAGYYEAFNLADVDADLVSGNVRSGTSIFGVAGDTNVVNTSSGTALPGQILTGRVAWVDGAQVTGTMADREGDNASTAQTAGAAIIKFVAPTGFYDGNDTVTATDAEVASLDSAITEANIVDGQTIFGVTGNRRVGKVSDSGVGRANLTTGNMDDLRVGDVILLQSVYGGYMRDDGDSASPYTVSLDPSFRYFAQLWRVDYNDTFSAYMFYNLATGRYLQITATGVQTGPLGDGSEASFIQKSSYLVTYQDGLSYRMRYSMLQAISSATGKCMMVSTWDVNDDTIEAADCTYANELWRFTVLSPH